MAALGRTAAVSTQAAAVAADFAHAAAHLAPDDQVEAMDARCRTCGAITVGAWQYATGGRRVRTPSEHSASPSLAVCDGSFQAAELTSPAERNRK